MRERMCPVCMRDVLCCVVFVWKVLTVGECGTEEDEEEWSDSEQRREREREIRKEGNS